VLAGMLGDRITRRATRGGHATLLAWAIALATPFLIATALAPSAVAAVGLLAAGLVCYAVCLAVPPMAIQALTPNEMRGQLIGGLTLLTQYTAMADPNYDCGLRDPDGSERPAFGAWCSALA